MTTRVLDFRLMRVLMELDEAIEQAVETLAEEPSSAIEYLRLAAGWSAVEGDAG